MCAWQVECQRVSMIWMPAAEEKAARCELTF